MEKKVLAVPVLVALVILGGSTFHGAEGAPCNGSSQCDPGEFCNYPPGICFSEEPLGVCFHLYDSCSLEWDPVCGCDGQTYTNAGCAAIEAVSVLHSGVCGLPVCGGYLQVPCPEGQYCQVDPGSCDIYFGFCVPGPTQCEETCESVCGCDGLDYPNECAAMLAGVTALHDGVCATTSDRIISDAAFDAAGRLTWTAEIGALAYRVYRQVVTTGTSPTMWECWLDGINDTVTPAPGVPMPGESWWLQVVGEFGDGEGPMGMGSDCAPREAAVSCP